jgi:hypothetical protein
MSSHMQSRRRLKQSVSILCMCWWTSSLACCIRRDGGPNFEGIRNPHHHHHLRHGIQTYLSTGFLVFQKWTHCIKGFRVFKSGWIVVWICKKWKVDENRMNCETLVWTRAFLAHRNRAYKIMSRATPHFPCPQHLCVYLKGMSSFCFCF